MMKLFSLILFVVLWQITDVDCQDRADPWGGYDPAKFDNDNNNNNNPNGDKNSYGEIRLWPNEEDVIQELSLEEMWTTLWEKDLKRKLKRKIKENEIENHVYIHHIPEKSNSKLLKLIHNPCFRHFSTKGLELSAVYRKCSGINFK